MNGTKLAALVLILGGVVALAYGTFSFPKETHEPNLGPIQITVEQRPSVSIPAWAGGGALALGVFLLVSSIKS